MNKTLYFTAGMPRSGSTLIQNILFQNPRFHATETSGFLDVLFSIRNQWDKHTEHKASPCKHRLKNVLKAILNAYYEDVERPVIFIKSRGFLAYIEMMEEILEQKVKILVPIRPIPEILASFEKLHRETSKVRQPPGEANNYFQFQTVQGRVDYWMRLDQVVGLSLNRLQDTILRGFQDRLHYVDFNKLTNNPKRAMMEIYEFLGEEWYEHNFNHVEQVTYEDDEVHGYVNLHKIQNKVVPVRNCAMQILGKEVVESLMKLG